VLGDEQHGAIGSVGLLKERIDLDQATPETQTSPERKTKDKKDRR